MRIFLALLITSGLFAADRKLPPELQPIAGMALAAPPEFAADGLLKLVESHKILDKPTAIELVQQSFDLASSAHFRVGMRARGGTPADSRSNMLSKAHALKLDTVSLQSRAVLAMLPLDKARARQMFTSIGAPELPPLSCDESLVYDVAPYYRALEAVLQSGFTAKERAKEDHVAFLLEYIARVHSPAQLAPMASLLKSANLTAGQRDAAISRFNGVIENLSGDYRSFLAAQAEATAAMAPEMQPSFDKYLEKQQAAATACPDEFKDATFWQSEDSKRLLENVRSLRFGNGVQNMLSESDRRTPAWQQKLADYEKAIADWSPASEKSEADYYHEKCIVYEALLELIPSGSDRDSALEAFIGFVIGSNLQSQSPVEWFMPVQDMRQRVGNSNDGEPAKLLAAFEASGNPVLALYAALERTFAKSSPNFAPSSP